MDGVRGNPAFHRSVLGVGVRWRCSVVRFLKRRMWVVFFTLFGMLIFLFVSYAALGWIARNRDPGPAVQVEFVDPDDPALVGQSVVVRGEAVHPQGIEHAGLWVNGEEVTSHPVKGSPRQTGLHFAWQPRAEGRYNVVLKAKSIYGVHGSSQPRLIQAVVQEDARSEGSRTQIILQEGDTVASVGEAFDVDPADIELPEGGSGVEPGESVFIMEGPEELDDASDATGEEESLDDLPEVEPVPPGEELVPLEGDSPGMPFWVSLPGVDLFCAALPEACGGGPGGGPPAKPDHVNNFALSGRCQVSVDWTDQSDNETGFRIFRVEPGVSSGLELVGEHPLSPGRGSRLSYLDEFAGRGRFTYIVQAYNGAGHVYMPASGEVETRCDETYAGSKVPVIVEVISLDVDVSRDQLYCYLSFGREPYSRVPRSYGTFIERREDGSWNISDFFSGEKGRRLWMPRENDLRLRGQCNVREGFMPLSRFSASIPPAQWDGREIVVGPEDGSYQATIRVFLSTMASGDMSLVDPDIPVPYNLKEVEHWQRCLVGRSCRTISGSAIAWEYPSGVDQPRAYQVFRRREGESEVEEVHMSRHPSWSAPIALADSDCALGATYSVNAITEIRDPITGEYIESPPSEEFEIHSECVEVEFTLVELKVNKIRDNCPGLRCDHNGNVYGTLWVGGKEVTWNFHSHSDGTISGGVPSTTHVAQGYESIYTWDSFYLNHGEGFDQNNHRFRIHVPLNEGFQINWEFKEHDKRGGDDNWCANRDRRNLFGRSASEWADTNIERYWFDGDDGDCEILIKIEALDE